jgi:uncharacterized membrane protein
MKTQVLTTASWLSFAAILYLILSETLARWVSLPNLGNIGFTLVFVVFAVLHCAAAEGGRFTAEFFTISAVVSYCMEEAGVRTGLLFGPYHYGDTLGAKLGDVPAIIPLAWFMMVYPCWVVARTLLRGTEMRTMVGLAMLSLAAALVMTGWDMVMDPGMAAAHNWVWEQGGEYFGVPLRNYFGWVETTFLIYWLAGWFWRGRRRGASVTKNFAALPVILYAFYALRYVMSNRIAALRAVAVFSMGLPAVLALARIREGGDAKSGTVKI